MISMSDVERYEAFRPRGLPGPMNRRGNKNNVNKKLYQSKKQKMEAADKKSV